MHIRRNLTMECIAHPKVGPEIIDWLDTNKFHRVENMTISMQLRNVEKNCIFIHFVIKDEDLHLYYV